MIKRAAFEQVSRLCLVFQDLPGEFLKQEASFVVNYIVIFSVPIDET